MVHTSWATGADHTGCSKRLSGKGQHAHRYTFNLRAIRDETMLADFFSILLG